MRASRGWQSAVVLTIVLAALATVPLAGTTTMDVTLGGRFTGTIDQAGVDVVQARFLAVGGASVRLTVQAARGSSLVPTVVIRDGAGLPIGNGSSQSIGWFPVGNVNHYFTIPASGSYVAEIGGSSGSGDFWASLTGNPSDVTRATVSGTVTDGLRETPLTGVNVFAGSTLIAVTDASGAYSAELLPGDYTIRFELAGFQVFSDALTVSAGATFDLDTALVPLVPVQLDASVSGTAVPGAALTATVEILAPAGTTIQSITWSQEHGVPAVIANGDTDTATVTLGSPSDYKDELVHVLEEPPVTQDDLPENVPLPPGEFPAGLQDRLQVVGIDPFSLERSGPVALHVEVVTDLGTFTDEVEVHTALPWQVATGLRNVAKGNTVLIRAKEQQGYAWTFNAKPAGSLATLQDSDTRHPYFTADLPGRYELLLSGGDAQRGFAESTIEVYAGTWRGMVVDQDIDGRPVPDTACTLCHNGVDAPDEPFMQWPQTGHAEIFTNNLNTSTHYSSNCFACHTVGYDPAVSNDGVDEAEDYQAFLDAGLLSSPGANWTRMLQEFPDTARMANAQCENCHGPQGSAGHGIAPTGEPRADISSSVCATCHGEPLRHARYQQWQLSAHANYELAIEEGESGSCARCHTGNGFLKWLPILLDEDPETDPTAGIEVTWTADEVHPQTCTTCHDPHAPGTTSGANTNARVRISGDTPPLIAGFTATDVGRGAICMTCHNSRRGQRNDAVYDSLSASDKSRAPHGSAQGDVLMGQNAYMVEVGVRRGHSMNPDTCVDCHMAATPPPSALSYNQGGTNHTFFASREICSECHSPNLRAEDVQDMTQGLLDRVESLIEDSVLDVIAQLTAMDYTVDLGSGVTITDATDVVDLQFGESRGRQAFTFTLTGGTEVGPVRVNVIAVLDDVGDPAGSLYDYAADALIKAGWNWNLINNDGSLGVHNPFFASNTLAATRDALVAIPGGKRAVRSTTPELVSPARPGLRPQAVDRRGRIDRVRPGAGDGR